MGIILSWVVKTPCWRGFVIRARTITPTILAIKQEIFYFCFMAKYKLHKQSEKDVGEGTDYGPDGRKVAAMRNIVFIAF